MIRPAIIAGAVVAALVTFGATYMAGKSAGQAECQLEIERAVAAEMDRQAQALTAVLAEAATREADAAAEAEELMKQVEAYEAELARECLVPEDDARRLNEIR